MLRSQKYRRQPVKFWATEADILADSRVLPEPASGCWLWAGSRNNKGHGEARVGSKKVYAHRVAYVAARGDIPGGLWVLHRCNQACCVNPHHLYLGNHADNMRDMANSGRAKGVNQGVRSGRALLTESDVRAIRSARGMSQSALAALHGVSKSCIAAVMAGRNWRHVNA